MRDHEVQAIAPNLGDRFYLYRPTAAFRAQPLCSLAELKTVLTIDDLADMHEAMNLQDATLRRAEEEAERERARDTRNGRRR
ncbi:hypothetical protein [Methylorubrum suomiense]|uniref:Uncharacterized protein n=1 Tax=Methylorubrum suomiense TaxID=144191 RepID=A0ABQ4V325_9HYPH|nr:hypothetical protein [Methylorubrum suomiense]GJE77287.1 hypothetical protein BGCPKDLD_3890 [Methylorubrum suomiense]